MQWWAALSVGLFIGSEYVAKKVNLFGLGCVMAIYFLYSTMVVAYLSYSLDLIGGVYADLTELQEAVGIGNMAVAAISNKGQEIGNMMLAVCAVAVYLGVNYFLLHNYRITRDETDACPE